MPRVKPEQRQWMEDHGEWPSFRRQKAELQDTGGCTPAEAHATALSEHYRPDDDVPRESRAKGPSQRDAPEKLVTSPAHGAIDDSELMSKEKALAGSDTSMLKSVKWVASVLGVKGLSPDDAPSPQAWSLYLTYGPRSKWEKFWERFGTAMLPTKADIEAKDRFTDDGRTVLALLDRLEREHDVAILQTSTRGVNP